MIGLYLKYSSFSGSSHKMRVGYYRFDSPCMQTAHNKDAGDGREYRLKCTCGGDSWSDDGRDMNEYCCECCGQFITVSPHKSN